MANEPLYDQISFFVIRKSQMPESMKYISQYSSNFEAFPLVTVGTR